MKIENLKTPLSKPPLKRVDLYIYFPSNLSVSERRSEYFNLIKGDYPLISIPENKNLQYNFGDCNFFAKDYSSMIGIAINYFSFSTIRYNKFSDFFENFKKAWIEFKKLFLIEQMTNISLIYDNFIKADKKIGYSFSDYFDIQFSFPGQTEKKFITVEGGFYFGVENGYAKLNFKPITAQDRTILEPDFTYNLEYKYQMEGKDANKFGENIDKMHQVIEDIFFSSLSEKYYNFIK